MTNKIVLKDIIGQLETCASILKDDLGLQDTKHALNSNVDISIVDFRQDSVLWQMIETAYSEGAE